MFMTDVHKKDEIRNIAIQELRTLGLKYRPKKTKPVQQETRSTKKVFKTALTQLPTQTVTLRSGQQLVVPKLVHELCSFILTKVETEGLFRKGGSKSRQNEIRLLLDAGCRLGDDHHEIDVASVLKTFLRELPEPLVPFSHHELFLRSVLLEKCKLNAVLLSCLLLPLEHLNTLAYFMQFLNQVTEHSAFNKMDAYNLAVVIGPTVFPVEEKVAPNAQHRLQKTCELFKLLVENAPDIGILPERIINRIALSCSSGSISEEDVSMKKKKKRRSGSLTRMLNGLKKIVGSKVGEDVPHPTPDLLATPRINKSIKKRRVEPNFSTKKKKDLLNNLTDGALRTPITPSRTPVCVNPNPKRKVTPESTKVEPPKDKKSSWYTKGKTTKNTKQTADNTSTKSSNSAKGMLERRWSAVSHVASFKKSKKRNSSSSLTQEIAKTEPEEKKPESIPENPKQEPDYVKISKTEYEEIKNRVSAIERRISMELESVPEPNNIENVQTAYEKTLVHVEPLSPTTDHLARRLSRELKIRRSAEQKVHRSPSARKIGTIRRRSREREKSARLTRNQSWHIVTTHLIPRVSARRSRLSDASPTKKAERAPSFHALLPRKHETWSSADGFFRSDCSTSSLDSGRASLARLRSQNAGMVLAKAKLFDGLVDPKEVPTQINHKIGAPRVRALIAEDKSLARKSGSPKQRRTVTKLRCQMALEKENRGVGKAVTEKAQVSPLKDCNREFSEALYQNVSPRNVTPRRVPVIKKPLSVKSPKRLCRTPRVVDRGHTPMRATRFNN